MEKKISDEVAKQSFFKYALDAYAGKKAFLFYASNLDVMDALPPEHKVIYAMALVNYGLETGVNNIPAKEIRRLLRIPFNQIDIQKRRYSNRHTLQVYVRAIIRALPDSPTDKEKIKKLNQLQQNILSCDMSDQELNIAINAALGEKYLISIYQAIHKARRIVNLDELLYYVEDEDVKPQIEEAYNILRDTSLRLAYEAKKDPRKFAR